MKINPQIAMITTVLSDVLLNPPMMQAAGINNEVFAGVA
jgi:hypothetical protein